MRINFFEQDVPDATALLHFRHPLEEKGIGKLFFDAINRCLERAGRMIRGGTIVDTTLISAPSSTKNAEKKRDSEDAHSEEGKSVTFRNEVPYRRGRRERLCRPGIHVVFPSQLHIAQPFLSVTSDVHPLCSFHFPTPFPGSFSPCWESIFFSPPPPLIYIFSSAFSYILSLALTQGARHRNGV